MSRLERGLRRLRGVALLLLAGVLLWTLIEPGGRGQAISLPTLPTNDLQQLASLTGYPTPKRVATQTNPQPTPAPVPAAVCGADSRPLAGEQGRVPAAAVDSAAAAQGWTCNTSEVGHFSTPGGFRVWRYVDTRGHVCAFYDTSAFSPLTVVSVGGGLSPGVVVLNMADPAHPVHTDTLASLPMLAPHESLNINYKRGLLAAEMGTGGTAPGLMSIYSVAQNCLHPTLDATYDAARFGHESGFAPDGNTFYIGGGEGIAAVDVTDPTHPHTLWDGNEFAHGLNVSDDGNTLYDSDPIDGDLTMLDVSQIQRRVNHPQVTEISRLTWSPVSIPQNSDPMVIGGKPYLLEFDEFAYRFNPVTVADTPGGARIIEIADPAHPRVVSDLLLAINMTAAHTAAEGDPTPLPAPTFDYSAHYCAIPREVDPQIAACSFINSGLRIFNISDPLHPREVAYFISPPKAGAIAGDNALSQPAFDPARREVWYSDATSGFYDVKLDPSVWPNPTSLPSPCAAPSGRLAGSSLGPVKLGTGRAQLRIALRRSAAHGGAALDVFCLAGGGIRVGYPSPSLLRSLPARVRQAVSGHAVLALTANVRYGLNGVTAGNSFDTAEHRLKLGPSYVIGSNTWYVIPGKTADGVLKTRGGVVQEIGLANKALLQTTSRTRRFLASF